MICSAFVGSVVIRNLIIKRIKQKKRIPRLIYIIIALSEVSLLSILASLIQRVFFIFSSSDTALLFSALDKRREGENEANVNVLRWDVEQRTY